MNKKGSAGFLIDLDGLLINSEELSKFAFEKMCDRLGCSFTDDYHASIRGKRKLQWAKEFSETFSVPLTAQEVAEIHEELLEKELNSSVACMPGARELLFWIDSNNYPRILVTSSTRDYAMKYLEKVELGQFFQTIVSAESVKNGKPDPEPYILGAKMINLSPNECIVLEDSVNGVLAGKSAGAMVIAVPSTGSDKEKMISADKIVSSLFEALEDLKLMGL